MAADKCEICGQAEATAHFIEVVAGKKTQRWVCEKCMAEKGLVIDPGVIEKAAAFLAKAVAPASTVKIGAAGSGATAPACPSCGMTWSDFKLRSRLGCGRCYDVFSRDIDVLLERLHGARRHHGRRPEHAHARHDRLRREAQLRTELDRAIESEDYERAARLRDDLRALGPEEGGGLGTL